jgi:hypothetical protein
MKTIFKRKTLQHTQNLIGAIKHYLIIAILLCSVKVSYANCSITTTVNASNLLNNISSCTGILTIQSGAKLYMNQNLTLPSSISEIVIKNGGQIEFGGPYQLHLDANTVLSIEDTINTNTQSNISAIYAPNQGGNCNNNTAVYIGTLKYSACTGGGNVCLTFAPLVQQGGSLRISSVIKVSGVIIANDTLCTLNKNNTTFNLKAIITQASSFNNPATYAWSVQSTPSGAPTPSLTNANKDSVTVTTFEAGQYVFKLTITQNLSSGSCNTAVNQIKETFVTVNVVEAPNATISGNATMAHNSSGTPLQSSPVTFRGIGNASNYTIHYTVNNVAQTPIITNGDNFTLPVWDTTAIGSYVYSITEIQGSSCSRLITGANATVNIVSPLSIDITQFKISENNCSSLISWTLGNETGVNKITLEKSLDAIEYKSIYSITPQGAGTTYKYNDAVTASEAYYRLNIVNDAEQKNYYSTILKFNSSCETTNPYKFHTLPNGNLKISGLFSGSNIQVVAANGSIAYLLENSKEDVLLDFQQLPSGIYFISISNAGKTIKNYKFAKM